MARGGSRPGAGRKRGGQCQKTLARRAIIDRLSAEDIAPLEVMLAAMKEAVDRGDMAAAAAFAKDAAPYIHPRLQAVMHAQRDNTADNPIARLLDEIDGKTRGIPSERHKVKEPAT